MSHVSGGWLKPRDVSTKFYKGPMFLLHQFLRPLEISLGNGWHGKLWYKGRKIKAITFNVPRFRKLRGWFTRFHHVSRVSQLIIIQKGKLMIFANDGNNDFQGIVCKKIYPSPKNERMTGWENPPWLSHRTPGPTSQELEAKAISDAEERSKKTHLQRRAGVGPFCWVGRSKHGRFR